MEAKTRKANGTLHTLLPIWLLYTPRRKFLHSEKANDLSKKPMWNSHLDFMAETYLACFTCSPNSYVKRAPMSTEARPFTTPAV
jgi:hypothetical protein